MNTPNNTDALGIFILNHPSDTESVDWIQESLRDAGYHLVDSYDESEIILFVLSVASLKSTRLEALKERLREQRDTNPDIEMTLGAILLGDIHKTNEQSSLGYDFVVDLSKYTNETDALEALERNIEGLPATRNWSIEPSESITATPPDRAGIQNVHMSFPLDLYLEWLVQAQDSINVLSTWIGIESYNYLLDAIERGVHTRFLMLEPDSPYAQQRTQDIFHFGEVEVREAANSVSNNIRESIRRFNDLYVEPDGLKGTFELRLYNTLPSFPINITDNRGLVGFFPHSSKRTLFPHLEISLDSPFGERVVSEFERIWINAKPHAPPTAPARIEEANQRLQEPLTPTELRVLFLACKGLSNSEIAGQLVVGRSTVRAHLNHIYGKLEIDGNSKRPLLLVRAQQLGLCLVSTPT